ncbi:MAG TPA: hypothetical protein VMB81_32450 [Candidatus Sulfotelmatobacter sp.]|nr:hypothetical protein [Candidatus Sulfotelmatobacter sp.]
MTTLRIALFAALAGVIGASALCGPARADDRDHRRDDRRHERHWDHDHDRYAYGVAPPPVVYSPPVVASPGLNLMFNFR